MDKLIELLTVFVVALSVLLFFGPIIVILSIVEEIKLWGRRVIRLPKVGQRPIVRVLLAVVGIGIWLAVYIPLVSLAKKSIDVPEAIVDSAPTLQATEEIAAVLASPTDTQVILPTDIVTPLPTSPPFPTVEMVIVPSGDFRMGTSYWSDADYDFAPGHKVYISEFYIDKYEVTNAQYAMCVTAEICSPPLAYSSNTREHYFDDLETYAEYPVIFVSWNDAFTFCEWREARLPTEAEWEKAAKWDYMNQKTVLHPWGEETPNLEWVNYRGQDTERVGMFAGGKSPVGAFEMAGNVYEWVYDFYAADYYQDSPERDPLGPNSSVLGHVVRGGAWSSEDQSDLWTFTRFYFSTTERRNDIGFRCASDTAP